MCTSISEEPWTIVTHIARARAFARARGCCTCKCSCMFTRACSGQDHRCTMPHWGKRDCNGAKPTWRAGHLPAPNCATASVPWPAQGAIPGASKTHQPAAHVSIKPWLRPVLPTSTARLLGLSCLKSIHMASHKQKSYLWARPHHCETYRCCHHACNIVVPPAATWDGKSE